MTSCPWCGTEIQENYLKVYEAPGDIGRTVTYCGDSLGMCEFSEAKAPKEGLPVMVVDEEIYRRPPLPLIATADKFAQMPWRGGLQMLFGQVNGAVQELTSRKLGTDIPKILERLEIIFERTLEAPRKADRAAGRSVRIPDPYDVVLATNMISVGVDIDRLGFMVVAGQPKTTSEYIQATSRVGRSKAGPGLVWIVYNWARPRDLSHYETFEHYHDTFHKHVEALSVTPFSPRELDRRLSGIPVSLLRLWEERLNANQKAGALTDTDPLF